MRRGKEEEEDMKEDMKEEEDNGKKATYFRCRIVMYDNLFAPAGWILHHRLCAVRSWRNQAWR